MSMLTTSLSGLQAASQQMLVYGQNIANAGTEGYSRQDTLTSAIALIGNGGTLYGGVSVDAVTSSRNELLDARIRTVATESGACAVDEAWYSSLETIFAALEDDNLSSQFADSADALSSLIAAPDMVGLSAVVIQELAGVCDYFNQIGSDLTTLRADAVETLEAEVEKANALLAQVEECNLAIRDSLSSGGTPNEIIDQRSQVLEELAGLLAIDTAELGNGMLGVTAGGSLLVGLEGATTLETIDLDAGDQGLIITGSTGRLDRIGGTVGSYIALINDGIPELQTAVDDMALYCLRQCNLAQATGIAMDGAPSTRLGATAFTTAQVSADLDLAVVSTGRSYGIQETYVPSFPSTGTATAMTIRVYDETLETETSYTITYDADAADNARSLQNLVDAINTGSGGGFSISPAATGVISASIETTGSGEQLRIEVAGGLQYVFEAGSELEEDILLGLGFGGLLTGTDASDIAVSQTLVDDPGLLAVNSSWSGDDTLIADSLCSLFGGDELSDAFNDIVATIGTVQQRAAQLAAVQDDLLASLDNQRQVEMGVDIDQQMTLLMQQQQIYQAASQLITIARENMDTLIAIVD